VRRQAAAFELTTGNRERVLLEEFVERGCFPKVALARASPFFAPAGTRAPQTGRVAP